MKQVFVLEGRVFGRAYEIVKVETDDDMKEVIDYLHEKWFEEDYGKELIDYINDELEKRYEDISIDDLSEMEHIGI